MRKKSEMEALKKPRDKRKPAWLEAYDQESSSNEQLGKTTKRFINASLKQQRKKPCSSSGENSEKKSVLMLQDKQEHKSNENDCYSESESEDDFKLLIKNTRSKASSEVMNQAVTLSWRKKRK